MKLSKKRIKEILSQYAPGANIFVSVSHEDIKALCILALEGMKTKPVKRHRVTLKAKTPRGKGEPILSRSRRDIT